MTGPDSHPGLRPATETDHSFDYAALRKKLDDSLAIAETTNTVFATKEMVIEELQANSEAVSFPLGKIRVIEQSNDIDVQINNETVLGRIPMGPEFFGGISHALIVKDDASEDSTSITIDLVVILPSAFQSVVYTN